MLRPSSRRGIGAAAIVALVTVCGCSEEVEPISVEVTSHCEWLLPDHCPLPWPSNHYTVADEETVTGLRVRYRSEAMPVSGGTEPFDPEPWNRLDGFSPSGTVLAAFPGVVDLAGVAGHRDIQRSLDADSPTVIIDAETGERVAHWAEVDIGAKDPVEGWVDPSGVLFYLRSASRLEDARRYVVALRGLSYADGAPVEASQVFAALRDGVPTDSRVVENRRPRMEDVLGVLEAAGVARDDLILAWDFTTASGQMLRGDLLAMRDDALSRLGPGGIGCTVTEVTAPFHDSHARIEGTFTAPSYMSEPNPPARLVRGPDGLPAFQELVEVPFVALIPSSLAEEDAAPGMLITYGHGLMGNRAEATYGASRRMAERHRAVMVATSWAGMAVEDVATLIGALTDVSYFARTGERLNQGMINQIALTRTMAGVCADQGVFDVEGRLAFDPEKRYWLGISQGGIFGATVMAISPDIDRGVLHVGGSNYALMIERSSNFTGYEVPFKLGYDRRLDRQLLLAVIQQLWDYTDPNTWLPHLERDPLPGQNVKETLYSVALHDAQVSNLSSDLAVRSAGFPLLVPSMVAPWGIPTVESPVKGSAYVVFDVGDPPLPETNETPADDPGGHGRMRGVPEHLNMVDGFLRDGVIEHPCEGPCVFD